MINVDQVIILACCLKGCCNFRLLGRKSDLVILSFDRKFVHDFKNIISNHLSKKNRKE